MVEHEQLVARFRKQLACWMVLQSSVAAIALWAFAWGTAVLAAKAAGWDSFTIAAWGTTLLPIMLFFAARQTLRRVPQAQAVRAMLDSRGGCGGLLMAGAERDLDGWRIPAVEVPRIQWNARRPLLILAIASGFAILAVLLPARLDTFAEEAKLDIARETQRLEEQIQVLKDEKILTPDRAETLAEKLKELRSQSAAKDPARTLEALDHLNDAVQQAAKQANESAAKQSKDLGKVQAGAEAIQNAAKSLDAQNLAAAMKELAAMAQKANEESDKLDESLEAALADGKLTTEQLKQLAEAAKSGRDSIKKSAKKMFDSRLIDSDQLKKCEGDCPDGKELSEYLKRGRSLKEAMGKQERKEQRGNGGLGDDGPGKTPLEFGDRASADGAKFREEKLPLSQLKSLKDNTQSGVSSAVPKKENGAEPPRSGSLAGATAGGGSSNSANVLPQHKAAVGKYFDRPEKK
jgi:hypothetical protein